MRMNDTLCLQQDVYKGVMVSVIAVIGIKWKHVKIKFLAYNCIFQGNLNAALDAGNVTTDGYAFLRSTGLLIVDEELMLKCGKRS